MLTRCLTTLFAVLVSVAWSLPANAIGTMCAENVVITQIYVNYPAFPDNWIIGVSAVDDNGKLYKVTTYQDNDLSKAVTRSLLSAAQLAFATKARVDLFNHDNCVVTTIGGESGWIRTWWGILIRSSDT